MVIRLAWNHTKCDVAQRNTTLVIHSCDFNTLWLQEEDGTKLRPDSLLYLGWYLIQDHGLSTRAP